MTDKFVFWAQALDNVSPDHIYMHGEELHPIDTARRQKAVSLVSDVVKRGTRIFDQRGVQLTEDGSRFVVEVPSGQPDGIGRAAPIICCGASESTVNDGFGASVAVDIDEFAHRIGRTIRPEHFELISESFDVLKKKYSTRKLVLIAAMVALVISLLAAWYRLASRHS